MSQLFEIHPLNPQLRLIRRAAEIIRAGGVIVYPTDSCYALGCHIGDKEAMERIRRIRMADKDHHFTLVCRDLSEIARYARIDNSQYRLLRKFTPGPYTFLLRATRETPKRLQNPRRRTIGIRVPDHPVPRLLLKELGEPIMSSTLLLPGDELPLTDALEIRERLEQQVDVVLDGGNCGLEPTTVIDLVGEAPVVVRRGRGIVEAFERSAGAGSASRV
ncbi:MAG TPA: L-threonylcarbamoyladenylate synthase [Steroidobacteraceae bacterium]|jgi:tRNA threonylcarbamoyl adenosine modification protein (Sua5/YciO/YrdC/YwlC family)|nr:L-threonylcarbamoyladenylate synthase [Steroidobacteraceae bacterium]